MGEPLHLLRGGSATTWCGQRVAVTRYPNQPRGWEYDDAGAWGEEELCARCRARRGPVRYLDQAPVRRVRQ